MNLTSYLCFTLNRPLQCKHKQRYFWTKYIVHVCVDCVQVHRYTDDQPVNMIVHQCVATGITYIKIMLKVFSVNITALCIHGHLFQATVCAFAAPLETRHWPLTFCTPLPAPLSHLPVSFSLSQCNCASRCLEALTHISAVYLSQRFHSAWIPCSLIRSWWREREAGHIGQEKMVGKGWTIGIRNIFPQTASSSMQTCRSLLYTCYCVVRDHTDKG